MFTLQAGSQARPQKYRMFEMAHRPWGGILRRFAESVYWAGTAWARKRGTL